MESFLSDRGKSARWPSKGILQQASEAQLAGINATIGMALDEQKRPFHFRALSEKVGLPPGEFLPYAPGFGLQRLRQAWRDALARKNPGLSAVPDEHYTFPVVTAGLTHALGIASELFLDDELLLFSPFWGNYALITEQVGAELIPIPLFTAGTLNIDGLRSSLSRKFNGDKEKHVLLLNFPNNPTGYSPTAEEAERIVDAVREAAERGMRLVIILDDAYFGLVYEEGILRESLFGRLASLHENVLAVKVDGASKEECAWGLRVGFLTFGGRALNREACRLLEEKSAGLVRASVSNVSRLSQQLVLKTLHHPLHDREKKEQYTLLKKRYERVKALVRKFGFETLPFNSGYFFCLKLAEQYDAESVRQELLKEGVGVIALPDNLLRIAYSSVPTEKLEALFTTLSSVLEKKC